MKTTRRDPKNTTIFTFGGFEGGPTLLAWIPGIENASMSSFEAAWRTKYAQARAAGRL